MRLSSLVLSGLANGHLMLTFVATCLNSGDDKMRKAKVHYNMTKVKVGFYVFLTARVILETGP